MKRYTFTGPEGQVKIKEPWPVRIVDSVWLILLLTVALGAWGSYYLYQDDKTVFTGRELSAPHRELKNDCTACHDPFQGVPNRACTNSDCHPEMKNTIHSTEAVKCHQCHPGHNNGGLATIEMDYQECRSCHEPGKDVTGNPRVTNVSRDIFRHGAHSPPRDCWYCHCTGKGTLDIKTKDLFKMDSCLSSGCHDEQQKDCDYCHAKPHPERSPSPRTMQCLHQGPLLPRLKGTKIRMYCTPHAERKRGFLGMEVCETGELIYKPPKKTGQKTGH
ncbi:MAG: hypothetical protein R6V10_05075 [bacterium]